ncbi:P-loop containing nucleoside triphosphate hydrolase protein [Dendrothele bispora CBS 962.96]|uniref:P-loop containing nucleoside triphosphate hydrolase protein n=1 Tax=Dendrothele bispora (strain CBS 962.96) TaxID=1314807 RepID=A0A4S8MZB5_DENBC|nr:P-loop containing nucleoside triphosphate hydrolase protein [Dendrothele bispora CBS 962.96]
MSSPPISTRQQGEPHSSDEDIEKAQVQQAHEKPVGASQHLAARLQLDHGQIHARVRTRWWQIWIPSTPPPPPRSSLDDAPVIPVVDASFLAKLTYTWVSPLMTLGYQRTLQASDLWKMHESFEAGYLSDQLDAAWARRVQKANEWNVALESGEIQPASWKRVSWSIRALCSGHYRETRTALEQRWREVDGRREPSLVWSLNDVFASQFWIGGFFKVFGDTCQLMGPLLVKALINFAKERASARDNGDPLPNIGRGIGMAIGLFCIVVVASLSQHQFFWRSMTTGVLTRAALTNSIYKRSVMLTGKSRVQLSNAELINHISTDVSRIDTASQWFHAGWAAPIQVLVCLIILLVQLGAPALAGFATFIIVVPIQERVMAQRLRIRKETNKHTGDRAKLISEVLGAMRIVKYFSYEDPFSKRIFDARSNELTGVRLMNHMQSFNQAFAYSIPVLAATIAFVAYTSTTEGFDVAVIFASLSLFQLLRQPMMFLPRALSATVDAKNALQRLSKIFHAEVMKGDPFIVDPQQDLALQMKETTFEWEMTSASQEAQESKETKKLRKSSVDLLPSGTELPFQVQNINMTVPKKSLVAIVGRVGSGKSSLLQGLIGEMRKLSGEFSFGGKVAYCPQTAWIQNATLRDNVLFGQPFDEERYWKVMEAACMIPDLQLLPDGDLTEVREIGEKGINLSGGQKQRVNIARSLYYNADIVLFDDPLSAVDAHVGKALFHGAIAGLVREGKTVILVTHALHFLQHCDYIYTMDSGRIAEHGTYEDLVTKDGEFARLDREFGGTDPDAPEADEEAKQDTAITEAVEEAKNKSENVSSRGAGAGRLEGKLIVKEKRSTGSVSWSIYGSYLNAGGGYITATLTVMVILLMQGSQIVNTYSLVWWQANTFNRPFSFYQTLYACLGISQSLFTFGLGISIDVLSTLVSKNLHNHAVYHILHAPMSFFDTTPLGRIQGVLGKDIDNLDNLLPTSLRLFALTIANVLGAIIVISILEYYFLIAAFFIAFGYRYFGSFYSASAREMKRLDAMLRSLLYAHFSESLTGLSTIRSYGETARFVNDNKYFIDLENRALFLTVTNQRWLAVRLDCLGAVLVFFIALFAVIGVSGISPAQIGVMLSYSTTLTQLCSIVTRQSAEVENYMNSVERIINYSEDGRIEQEPPHEIESTKPLPQWPSKGAIELKNISMSYRPGLPNVLHVISLSIKAGEKIGIVGRTGAGKSSLTLALLRIVEFSGSIFIDDVDISKIGLRDLRTKIGMIPQDPTLFSGTVRSALDPFSLYDDARLWDALRRSYLIESGHPTPGSSVTQLDEPANNTAITLDSVIEAEGANLSVGQRSLLSLARALVKDTRVVILDEATASVDLETDRKIQETIQSEFDDRTLLCIAHRLRTIIGYDRILVMDAGRVAEFDTPSVLFTTEGSIFHSLCEESGISLSDIQKEASRKNTSTFEA